MLLLVFGKVRKKRTNFSVKNKFIVLFTSTAHTFQIKISKEEQINNHQKYYFMKINS